jgi:hypothetical protein
MTTYTCTRCNGTGRFSFNLIHGTKCYGCQGTGQQRTKPRKPAPKWAVFGQHRATGSLLRLYNVTAKTAAAAIESARQTYARGGTDWQATYSLDGAQALRWDQMKDLNAIDWEDATGAKP